MFCANVFWTDDKGAGRMRNFADADNLATFLSSLRQEAIVRNAEGEKIGSVEFAPDLFSDGRQKWAWYFDQDGALTTNTLAANFN